MELSRRGAGVAAVVGGLMWALIPYLDGYYPAYELTWWIIPLLLISGTYGLRQSSEISRAEQRLLTTGFGLMLVGALLNVVAVLTEGSIVFLVFIGVPALAGSLTLALGSASTASGLWKRGVVPRWLALSVGLSLPIDPLFNALVTGVLGGGLSLYGITWVMLGGWMLVHPVESNVERTDRRTQPQ